MISLEISFYNGYIKLYNRGLKSKKMCIIVCLQNALNEMSLEKKFQHNTSETNCTLSLFAYCELMGFKTRKKIRVILPSFVQTFFRKKRFMLNEILQIF